MSNDKPLISPPFRWIAIFGGAFCLLMFILFKFYGFYPTEIDLGPTAKVRYTPYHTAGELLKLERVEVEHFRDLKKLNEPLQNLDVLIVSAKPGHINEKRFKTLTDWVEDGGQLIYWVNRKTETENDPLLNYLNAHLFKDEIASKDKEIEEILEIGQEVLPQLGHLIKYQRKPIKLQLEGLNTDILVGFDPSWHLRDYSGDAYYFSNEEKDHALHYYLGEGTITLLSDMNFWLNPNIAEHDHGFFLQQLLSPQAGMRVWFMFGGEHESALSKLQKQAMPLFWIFLLFLVLWLWRQIPRLGPKRELNLQQRRNIAEHIGASSQLRWQQQQITQWLEIQAKIINKKASIRNPAFSQLEQTEQINWLAQIGSVEPQQLTYLYQQQLSLELNETQFLELMHQLQQLKNRL